MNGKQIHSSPERVLCASCGFVRAGLYRKRGERKIITTQRTIGVAALALLFAIVACGGPSPDEGRILDVKLAHGIDENTQPIDPGGEFCPEDTIYLTVTLSGRPKAGVYTARFFWKEDLIVESVIDLAKEELTQRSILGGNTNLGFTVTHEQAFPVSPGYKAEVLKDGVLQGTYSFVVVPPADAIPSKITEATLAQGIDDAYRPVKPTTTFLPAEMVYLAGRGDLGLSTWLQAHWYVGGALDPEGTKEITLAENAPDAPFTFSFIPAGGWPEGAHEVALRMNDVEVGRYPFNVSREAASEEPGDVLFQDDFSDPKSGWDTSVKDGYVMEYDSGGYSITITQPNLTVWSQANQEFGDVRIEVDAKKLSGPDDNYFGLACRMNGSSLYILFVGSDGLYGIYKISEGSFEQLITGTTEGDEPTQPGDAVNHLRAECISDQLALYANGELLGRVTDSEFDTGDVGLLAATFDQAGLQVLFDNFVVFQP